MPGQEKLFENKIKKFLTEQDVWFVKFFANNFTRSGIPDLLCCVNGKFVAIEVKSDKGKPSVLQLRQIELIKKSNGIGLILYPKDFEEFKNLIMELKHAI